VFGEVVVPVFADSPMGESLDLNAAMRFTDYSTSGEVETWKLGFTYKIAAGVSLRGTQSEDIRAPNLNEYFSGGATVSTFFDDSAVNPADVNVLVPRTISGNPELDPEVASTTAFGIVYQPEFLDGSVLSVDYFDINIEDAINSVDDQSILDRCAGGETAFCSLAVRDGSGTLIQVFNGPINFAEEQLSGYDIEASYSFEAAGGTVDIRTLWTYTDEHYTVDRGLKDDLLGEYSTGQGSFAGGPQEWVGLTSIRYSTDNLTLSLRNRYIGEGVIDADWTSGVDVDENTIDSVAYFDVTAAYTFILSDSDTEVEIFGSIDNLLDEDPPVAVLDDRTALDHVGVESRHDVIGRYFRAGVRVAF
jgi:outer membrane receptor protein involved in Fe transport